MFEKCATGYPICRSVASIGIKLISKYRRKHKKGLELFLMLHRIEEYLQKQIDYLLNVEKELDKFRGLICEIVRTACR